MRTDLELPWVKFVKVEIEAPGTAGYTRISREKEEMPLEQFLIRFRESVADYSEHVVAAWFLRNCKLELLSSLPEKDGVAVMTSDFAENVKVLDKHETGDQYFHKREIALFGTTVTVTGDGEGPETTSYLTTSNYRS